MGGPRCGGVCALCGVGALEHPSGAGGRRCRVRWRGPKAGVGRPRRCGLTGQPPLFHLRSLHFTPTYSSWLNQVENWFSKIERDLIARGIFTSKRDLARKIMRYIKHHNVAPKPIRWTYSNPERRIRGISSTVTVH